MTQDNSIVLQAIQTATQIVSRIEQFSEYSVPGDREIFEKYKNGELYSLSNELREYYNFVEKITGSGISFWRLRVFDTPLTDYQKYEIDWGYLLGEKFGQETFAIRREMYNSILSEHSASPCDFWYFDRKKILEVKYTDDVDYIGVDEVSESSSKQLLDLHADLERRCVGLHDFMMTVEYESKVDLLEL
jgi:hypothetical protein